MGKKIQLKNFEFGRTMLEMLAVFSIIAVLGIAAVYMYKYTLSSIKSKTISRQIALYVQEYRHRFMEASDNITQNITDPHGITFTVQNGTGSRNDYFALTFELSDKDLSEKILESHFIDPVSKEVNGPGNSCPGKVTLWFSKDPVHDKGTSLPDEDPLLPEDPCDNITCNGHGSCSDGACTCTDNYYGENCENAPLSCQNGGTWDTEGHECNCVNGYSGNVCQTEPDQCYDVTCGSGASCIDGECQCDDEGYEYSSNYEKCIPTCNSATQQRCSNETDAWCCTKIGEACTSQKDVCRVVGEKCAYSLNSTMHIINGCSYQISISENKLVLTEEEGCSGNTYCYLRFNIKNGACQVAPNTAGIESPSMIYGTCLSLDKGREDGDPACGTTYSVETIQGCSPGKYCYGKWDAMGNLITGNFQADLYGMCMDMGDTIDTPEEDDLNPWKSYVDND